MQCDRFGKIFAKLNRKNIETMKRLATYLLVLAATLLLPGRLRAQTVGADSDSVTVSLITIYPGSEMWSIYGHTELRVTTADTDLFFNYGVFDFNGGNFVYRFVKGETDYMCAAFPYQFALQGYGGRKVVEQVLNLTQPQARAVRETLLRNALPQNATYRYKYFSDNCSTRPRDIIEAALGTSLSWGHQPREPRTYRDIMSHYNDNYAWERFGIALALGSDADTLVTARQELFIPMLLMQAADSATVTRGGVVQPLVVARHVLISGPEQGAILPATPWWQSPMALACLLLAITLAVTWRDWRRHTASRKFDSLLYLLYALGGCMIAFLVFVSTHESTTPNWVLLWLNPLYLVPMVAVWFGACRRWLRIWFMVASAALALALLVPALGLQCYDPTFYPLILAPLARHINYIRSCSATTK